MRLFRLTKSVMEYLRYLCQFWLTQCISMCYSHFPNNRSSLVRFSLGKVNETDKGTYGYSQYGSFYE